MMKKLCAVFASVLALAAVTFAAEGETVTVMGRGRGANRTQALEAAYKDAIVQAVGQFLDAEELMRNQEMVKDQILTHSNAYIERYDIRKETDIGRGVTEIQILAVVKKAAITRKIQGVMPTQTVDIGSAMRTLHAKSTTTGKRDTDAGALLKNVLKDMNPVTQLMRVTLSSPQPQLRKREVQGEKDKELVYFRFNVTLDEKKYFGEFLPPLLAVFDQIALKTPKTVYLQSEAYDCADDDLGGYSDDGQCRRYLAGKCTETDSEGTIIVPGFESQIVGNNGIAVGVVDLASGDGTYQIENGMMPDASAKAGKSCSAMVIVQMNASRSVIQAKHYELPAECAGVLAGWMKDLCKGKRKTSYNVLFTDSAGEPLLACPISFDNKVLLNFSVGKSYGQLFGHDKDQYGLYLTPMVSMYAKARERWVGFDIPRDLMPDIQSVQIELAE